MSFGGAVFSTGDIILHLGVKKIFQDVSRTKKEIRNTVALKPVVLACSRLSITPLSITLSFSSSSLLILFLT